jgi:ubiquinone/menaquinone biosynthesis C-methylase UbiE
MLVFLNPEEVLAKLALSENLQGAEFGCGSGKFSFLLAKKLAQGRVYAIDIQSEPLSVLESRAQSEGIYNIQTIHSDLERGNGSNLPAGSLDVVLIPNLLFQVDDKKAVLEEAARILKTGGQILIVDWKPEADLNIGKQGRVSVSEIKKIVKDLPLELSAEFEAGSYHWGLVFTKV